MPTAAAAPAAPTASATAPAAAAPAAPAKASGPLTPEQQTERRNFALLSLNAGTFSFIVLYQVLGWSFLLATLVALPVAAVAFGVVWKIKS